MKFMPNEQCYRAFAPTPKHPMGDIIRHLYHDGLKAVDDAGLLFKTRDEARNFLKNLGVS